MNSSRATSGKTVRPRLGVAALLLALASLLAGCDLIGLGQPAPTPVVVTTPRPRPSPTATPSPTPTPSAVLTPTPAPNLNEALVQQLVFRKVRPCVDQLSQQRETAIQVTVETVYLSETNVWQSKATSRDGSLFFGTWHVKDFLDAKVNEPTPMDTLAQEIAAPNVVCTEAASRLSPGSIWPVATTPTPTPTTAPTPTPILVTPTPTPTPAGVITGAQAEVRVWVAVYNCFSDERKPKRESFKALQDNPQRWFVEGKGEETTVVDVERPREGGGTETFQENRRTAVYYGFWLVDAATGQIQPWDANAQTIFEQQCYKAP